MQRKIKKAVIPAAGLGTRFLPATKAQPKEMLPIVDKPTLQYIIEEAVESGIEEILIITGKNKKSIEDHFDKSVELELELEQKGKTELLEIVRDISKMINIYYIRQKEPRGLGDAIYCARSFIGDEPFAVMLGDDIVDNDVPCLKQLMSAYEEYRTTILGVQTVPPEDANKYGIIYARREVPFRLGGSLSFFLFFYSFFPGRLPTGRNALALSCAADMALKVLLWYAGEKVTSHPNQSGGENNRAEGSSENSTSTSIRGSKAPRKQSSSAVSVSFRGIRNRFLVMMLPSAFGSRWLYASLVSGRLYSSRTISPPDL